MRAADVMDVASVPETAAVRDVARPMIDKRIGGVTVVDEAAPHRRHRE